MIDRARAIDEEDPHLPSLSPSSSLTLTEEGGPLSCLGVDRVINEIGSFSPSSLSTASIVSIEELDGKGPRKNDPLLLPCRLSPRLQLVSR